MTTVILIIVAVVALAAIAGIVALRMRKSRQEQRTTRLHEAFGPEYERTVTEKGRGAAESDLDARSKRAESGNIRALTAIEGQHYLDEWTATQARFVDDPSEAVTRADRLVTEVLQARGYPITDFAAGANAVSVDHPRVVIDYRAAHEASEKNRRGTASTDDLRAAMTSYRSVFTELVDVRGTASPEPIPVAVD